MPKQLMVVSIIEGFCALIMVTYKLIKQIITFKHMAR